MFIKYPAIHLFYNKNGFFVLLKLIIFHLKYPLAIKNILIDKQRAYNSLLGDFFY